MNREHNKWYTAYPPYHNCSEGIGPADYFGKILLDSIREDIRIGFIPCALSGQAIEMFMKGQMSQVPDWCNSYLSQQGNVSVYDWMRERCELAQDSGVIKGILFHQGEANTNDPAWPGNVAQVVSDLRNDLNLGEEVPFLAGEVLRSGGSASHNTQVAKIPSVIPNSYVISSEGLVVRVGDTWNLHFSCESVRTFSRRYAEAFLSAVDNDFVPRKGTVTTHRLRAILHRKIMNTSGGAVSVYSLDGKAIRTSPSTGVKPALHAMRSTGVYIVSGKLDDGTTAIVPCVKE